jgi:hypothetical protein
MNKISKQKLSKKKPSHDREGLIIFKKFYGRVSQKTFTFIPDFCVAFSGFKSISD